jgi:hypothetical protein
MISVTASAGEADVSPSAATTHWMNIRIDFTVKVIPIRSPPEPFLGITALSRVGVFIRKRQIATQD